MSYDLMVFEKSKAPTNHAEFMKWYLQKTQWSANCDYNDISHACENLQKFFYKVKDIFPPMNGPFSPTVKELSENPKLEPLLSDYCIDDDLIYIAFAYSVSERAYDIIRRAAYFSDIGFFNPQDNIPVFFDKHYPMFLQGEWFGSLTISDFDDVRQKLREMTMENKSFMYITDQIGNYIQVGGFGEKFTVEKRVYTDIMDYTHTTAELSATSGINNPDETDFVIIAQNPVKLKKSQILSIDIVEQLFSDFFYKNETKASVNNIKWQ